MHTALCVAALRKPIFQKQDLINLWRDEEQKWYHVFECEHWYHVFECKQTNGLS